MKLTDQQTAVVAHESGPALVFAVAGAGKTTAMVHRIERLVRDGVVPPQHVLATSFGRANVYDLRQALAQWPHCRRVDVRTLHALGRDVIRKAQRLGHLRRFRLDAIDQGNVSLEQRLLSQAMAVARSRNLPFKQELDGLDRQDFLDYVDQCKGNLRYASLGRVKLPPAAQRVATQATDPSPQLTWYLDLYRLYEELRQEQGLITFADMLMTGWEVLATQPEVLTAVCDRYHFVLVDEFQDINLAQAEMLDLITAPNRNYMAIGDDDQTIYEWRGASPHFILKFPERYEATTYLISDNFRCPAAPLLLANRVIVNNAQRQEKQLNLTRGFGGETAVHVDDDLPAMSRHIVQRIRQLQKDGTLLRDVAVLVRLNAQTPPIEQALIAHKIPYRVSQPFYERMEIKTLIQYGRIAWIERELRRGKRPLSSVAARELFGDAWRTIVNRPKRYISNAVRRQLHDEILRQERPLSAILAQAAEMAEAAWQEEPLAQMAADIAWLADNLDKPAQRVLHRLDVRLDYQTYLRQSSGFAQTGEGRAVSVATFIDYARDQGSFFDFMQHLRKLARNKVGQEKRGQRDVVTLSTIHQAKGLEWPVVFVAQCNQEIMPFLPERVVDDAEKTAVLAEERRLFYVALTRTQRDLHLHLLKRAPVSQFVTESGWQSVLAAVSKMAAALDADPAQWQATDVLPLARHAPDFQLGRYFATWWDVPPERQTAVAHTVQRFLLAARKNKLWSRLKLKKAHLVFWQALAPLPDGDTPANFPGLEKLAAQPKQKKPRKKLPLFRPDTQASEFQPDVVMAGMWVRCDAGWGRIEQIMDLFKREQKYVMRGDSFVRLAVTLRPELDAVPVEIDVSASRIKFAEVETLFTCAYCDTFTATEATAVTDFHHPAAHPREPSSKVRQQREPTLKLSQLYFSTKPPDRSLG